MLERMDCTSLCRYCFDSCVPVINDAIPKESFTVKYSFTDFDAFAGITQVQLLFDLSCC